MGGGVNCFWFQLFIALSLTTIARSEDDCVYTAYIRTGSIIKGGTDSIISLTLYDEDGWGIRISNLEAWGGLMGPNHDYFERGNLDIFSGKGPCLNGPVCSMNLTSDGSGPHHGWYCNYVEVTTTGPHKPCSQQLFTEPNLAFPPPTLFVRSHRASSEAIVTGSNAIKKRNEL
ncbi:hypothetical protein TEA_019259 [Camellia sinensis var. sinensis]|uniref:PLAT domain-containing protein n=1 Tax=Camellia sinensis var. sinensis TaxID=542762 RepID=A0A4S4DV35_CAMSN|nr:hypothetical protein TEA_019259 [Camellia sinensis var. sinensis]